MSGNDRDRRTPSQSDSEQDKTASDYKVGYRRPPLHSRFKPGTSGNPRGRPKKLKVRNIHKDLQQVYLREISVREGDTERRLSAVVLLYEKLVRDALKGNAKAANLAIKLASELGVLRFKDEVGIDLSVLTPRSVHFVAERLI